MPTAKEFSIRMEDRPGTLAKIARALGERNVNILAFQSLPFEGQSLVRFVADNPATAKTVLDNERVTYQETDVARASFAHRPGELARAAMRLGEAGININYAYSGLEPGSNAPLLIFGVKDAGRAVSVLEQGAAAGAGT